MGSTEVVGGVEAFEDGVRLVGTMSNQHISSVGDSENLGDELLEGLDSYLEDIDDRLTVSRMVSVSVIKGMVEAVDKMAEEKIAEKELELANMREKLRFWESGGKDSEGIAEVSNVTDGLDSLLAAGLEEMMQFQKMGGEISERINEVSNARNEIDSLLKLLPCPEFGQLVSQGSSDMDNNRKLLSSNVSTSSSFWVENGHSNGLKDDMPETWDADKFGHSSRQDLVAFFNSTITNMRRAHESQVQKMTEDYFSLKREYFKKNSLQHQKDKDLEIVRKKIPKVILKLDNIIVENKKLSAFSKESDTITRLKNKVNDLLLENQQLRETVANEKREIKSLTLQVSDAGKEMLQHSFAEVNLNKLSGDLESAAGEADVKTFLIHEIYDCVMKGLTLSNNSNHEELDMLCVEAAQDTKDTNTREIEDSDIESLISQELCEVILKEAIKEVMVKVDRMTIKYEEECDSRISLENKVLEREEEVKALIEENGRLKQEVGSLEAAINGEKMLSLELSATLAKEKDVHELVSYELNSTKGRMGLLESSLSKREEELDRVKGELVEALDQIELGKLDLNKTNQKVNFLLEELRAANEERNTFQAILQKKEKDVAMLEVKKDEQRKQWLSAMDLNHGLLREFSEFEGRLSENINQKTLRLRELNSLLQSLFKKTNILKTATSIYKHKLERKCADLETAETEVDLLGDQVDSLLNLLEKVYIGLDHYSPILQHYPGIMEILKLVRRELSGESVKLK